MLSVYVSLPGPIENGPYPTLIEYSGYEPSQPGEPLTLNGADLSSLCGDFPVLCDAPKSTSGLLASVLGFATVGVNMRGTGCSGGAYDFFETPQLLDGYDVVEVVAAQDWVQAHEVGMSGISYPGISQLFVAKMHPPSLVAITPLAVIADTARSVLAPGGILNNGFALQWAENVLNGAAPFGQGWEQARVDAGDTTCAENQLLHGQKVDLIQQALSYEFYPPELSDPLSPAKFVDRIDVPVFLAGAWQDEQTGPHFAGMLDRFRSAPLTRFTVYNGVHEDGFAPQVLAEWFNFLSFYVAKKVPVVNPQLRGLAPAFFATQFGGPIELPPDRFDGYATFAEALAAYEAEPALRIIFESGADATAGRGVPVGTFDVKFSRWPVPGTTARRFYLQPDSALADTPPTLAGSASSFRFDPDEGQRVVLRSGSVWDALPDYDYRELRGDYSVVFESAALAETLVMAGHGSVDLWLRSTAEDADLEVTLTEVRPDGMEMYVQSGWLRASHRALSAESTELHPVHTHAESDGAPLVPGEWVQVRVELMPFAHVFRPGSRIRLAIDTPGETRAVWKFQVKQLAGDARHSIGHSAEHASSIALPVIPGVTVPSPLPACPSLRGQPCRPYQAFTNTPG
jgi:predicted acyl esterase